MPSSTAKYNVPDELRNVLLQFTISYLLEQPPVFLDYAVEFFTKLRDNRTTTVRPPSRASLDDFIVSVDDEPDEPPPSRFSIRRRSVFAEAYDPEADDNTQKVVFPKSDEKRHSLAESVKKILLFRSLDSEQLHDVLDAMFERRVVQGEYVIKQGDDGDNFYVIQSGIYHAYVKLDNGTQKLIHMYHDKGSFGELALLYNQPRAATIQAGSEGSLWALNRQTFRRIVLKSAFNKRRTYEALIDCVPILKMLQSYERLNLADALIPKTYEEGKLIIKQGDVADGMYFVEEGTVKITRLDENANEVPVKEITKGGYFGELALVTNKPRAASAYSSGKSKLAFLDVEAFERLLGPCMDIMKRNIDDYESQLEKIFGSKHDISDIR